MKSIYKVTTIDGFVHDINADTSDVLDGGILILMIKDDDGKKGNLVFAAKDWICVQKVEE